MTPIIDDSDINQNLKYIHIDIDINLSCDGKMTVPDTIFTIFPSNNEGNDGVITVETSPPNLVTVKVEEYKNNGYNDGNLYFQWNKDVSSTATIGGVRIGVPPDQLKSVWVKGRHNNAQILDGFTTITYLSNDGSILRASMTSLSNSTELELTTYGGGQMYVETNVLVTGAWFFGGGQTWVETPSIASIALFGDGSELNIKGDADVISVSDGAQLTVTGTITGTIFSYDDSIVNAPSCDNVTSSDGSICNAGPQSVDVYFDVDVGNLSQNSQILYGTHTCGGEGSSFSYVSLYGQGSSSIVVIAITTITIILLQ